MIKIAIMNQKGGTAKTTSVINISGELVRQGKKVLIIDMDTQGNATSNIKIISNSNKNMADAIIDSNISINDIICNTAIDGLDIIKGGTLLANAFVALQKMMMGRETVLKRLLNKLSSDIYDFILFDCSPSLESILNINVLVATDYVLIPIRVDKNSIEGYGTMLETIKEAREMVNPNLKALGVFMTAVETGSSLDKEMIKTRFSYEVVKHEQLSPMFVPTKKYNLTKEEKILVYQAIYYHHEREKKEINAIYIEDIIREDIKPRIQEIKKEFRYEIEEDLNTIFIKYIRNRIKEGDKLYIEYCLLKGLLHRLDHSSSAKLKVEDDTSDNISDFTDKFLTNKGSKPNELQEFCRKNNDNNLIVIASTGVGKTESALYWSSGKKTFFTLPLRTSINAIYDRIEDTIGYKHTGLLHSTALEYLEEKDEFENEEEKYEQSRNLCKKVTVCTIDQIFPFVFKYKGYEKIYATLGYSKIIIDEIQAYSPEIVAVIIKGLEMINKIGGKFMLMTATLPKI